MSWQERDYAEDDPMRRYGRPGGDWQGVRPSLDNPFTWSVFLFRISGIAVRVHFFFLMMILIELGKAIGEASKSDSMPMALGVTAILLGGLFVIVLAHEFGHCIACRWSGGDANEILMWPLGGLAFCRPPNRWKAHLITVIGGPMVNVILFAVIAPILGLLTGEWWGVAIPNPFTLGGFHLVAHSWPLMTLYLLNHINFVLLLFNVALPMFPMDGGRIMQALLWSRMGYSRSMRIALRVGYVGAIVLGLIGVWTEDFWLVGIAVFGGITCYHTHKQLEWTDSMMGMESDEYALGSDREEEQPKREPKPTRAERRAQKEAQRELDESREVDRILQKIHDHGRDSLTSAERGLLQRVTERKRQEQQ